MQRVFFKKCMKIWKIIILGLNLYKGFYYIILFYDEENF